MNETKLAAMMLRQRAAEIHAQCNPNSDHQLWSRWTMKVFPGPTKKPSFADVRDNAARFARKIWGSTGEMNVEHKMLDGRLGWLIDVRVEGHPAHDYDYVLHTNALWLEFLENGFGPRTYVRFSTKVEAGDVQDGKPRSQLIIMPSTPLLTEEEIQTLKGLH